MTKIKPGRIALAYHLARWWMACGVAMNILAYVIAGSEAKFIWFPFAVACYHIGRLSVITEEPACVE